MSSKSMKQNSELSTFKLLHRSLRYLKPYWKLQLMLLFVAILLAILSLVTPWINKLLIDDVLIAGDINGLKLICLLFLGAYFLQSGLGVLQAYLYAKVGGKAVLDLRRDLFTHLQSLSISYYQKKKTGNIIALFISDISIMRGLYTSTLVSLATDVIRFLVLVVVMCLINSSLSLIALICLPFYGFFMKVVGKPIRAASAQVQENRAEATGELQEKISGIREIKAFVREKAQGLAVVDAFRRLYKSRVKLSVINSLASISGLISALGIILVIWFGGKDVISHQMQMGVFIAFLGFMGRLFGPVNTFLSINNSIHSAMGAASRVFNAMDSSPELKMNENPKKLDNLKKIIEFRNISFRYPDSNETAIDKFSLCIFPGQTIALVGSSGSGKTTLAMLLLRFYDPDFGSIMINGFDLRDIDLNWFREKIGIVFQDPFLFNMSVRDNIIFGKPDVEESKITRAAEAAYASEFITKLPREYDTIIGERGVSLSGGQQQRLAIARAIIKEPDVVILDEATSALDTESENLVQKAMMHLLKGRTNIVIAHRLSTVKNADTIVVIERGKIVEKGSYSKLIEQKGRFWELHNTLYE